MASNGRLETNVEMIAGAGFDGLSSPWTDRAQARRVTELVAPHGLVVEGMCFPRSIDDLQPVLEIASEFKLHHTSTSSPMCGRAASKIASPISTAGAG